MLWKEAIMAYFKGVIPAITWRDWRKPRKTSERIACLRA
jgi:hypothetical protein